MNRKQFSSRIEKSYEMELQFVAMAKATAETIYAGKRPNLVRIYDKLAEWNVQVRKLQRAVKRFNAQMDKMGLSDEQRYYGLRVAPTLEQFCSAHGHRFTEGDVLTRIERQAGGDRIPDVLRTFGDLYSASEFRPFDALRLPAASTIVSLDVPPKGAPVRDWLAAVGLRTLIEHTGSAQAAHSIIFKYANGNGRRIMEALDRCTPNVRPAVTIDEIHESFRKSTLQQTS